MGHVLFKNDGNIYEHATTTKLDDKKLSYLSSYDPRTICCWPPHTYNLLLDFDSFPPLNFLQGFRFRFGEADADM
ncbi:unnamed protein product [Rhodiola kirilowii]